MQLRSIPRIAAILAVAALPACAAETGAQAQTTSTERPVQMADAHGHRHHGMHGHHGSRAGMMSPERIEGRLAFLKTELKITDAQAPQWNAFADFLRNQSKAMQARHAEFRERRAERQKQGAEQRREARPLTERLAMHEKFMEKRLEQMRAFKTAVEPLYNVLSPDQRKTADQLLARRA